MPGTPETPQAARQVSDAPSPRRLLSTEKVYEGRIWDVVSDSFQLSETGESLTRDYIDHPGAVAVLPMNDAGEVLLIRQYRHPVGMDLWEIPAGLLDVEGEDFVAGAARELAEEADLAAGEWNVLVDFFNSPGSSSEAIRIYLARDLTDVPHHERHERTDEEAEIEFHWIALDDAVAAVLEGRLHNPSAVVGILAAAAAKADGFAGLRPADAPWPAHPSQR
ncbi:ADP-ribose pyrophosphatase [Arthrobacter sp. Hiyo4]|uniref:NUDIX domain-containing protein n=1 Tax=Micrococcaceae TaxID=1268 RepID=UPI0006838A78|nr:MULTISPECIES: NUDIX hydrolase [Micrococcaceae]BAS08399.1 ADP-ribose pyrophosphatase [Arthrobacter sp. Hiyo4]KRE78186.1 ADP-ribose pyrophosphatase [Arthrobacter sp. Soil762]MCO4238324.1 NUDIX hydrolase [Pseudarthrobacter sp. MDT3-28]MCO4251003.1 NUDIX hydrolase [Pseudarthrobacter sp. MDT3-9]MCO4262969.1 NUDIX hydrolase [Pseudarthrobacter sp. MDT3-26]